MPGEEHQGSEPGRPDRFEALFERSLEKTECQYTLEERCRKHARRPEPPRYGERFEANHDDKRGDEHRNIPEHNPFPLFCFQERKIVFGLPYPR